MEKVFFVGEYGFAFRQLLPFLERYNGQLELATWAPLCKIIELIWLNRFITIEIEKFFTNVDCVHRAHVLYEKKDDYLPLIENGYKDICLLDPKEDFFHVGGFEKFYHLKQKIMFGPQMDNKPYVSIFPRNRKRQPGKNHITNEHVSWLKNNYPDKEIFGHGLPEERIDLGIRYCKDIYEQINVFNNSENFVCPSSGLADLALMCGCNLLLTGEYPTIEEVNPHKCRIKYWNWSGKNEI